MKIKRAEPSEVRGIRYPTKLWKALAKRAEENGRTVAKEIIQRLQISLKQD